MLSQWTNLAKKSLGVRPGGSSLLLGFFPRRTWVPSTPRGALGMPNRAKRASADLRISPCVGMLISAGDLLTMATATRRAVLQAQLFFTPGNGKGNVFKHNLMVFP